MLTTYVLQRLSRWRWMPLKIILLAKRFMRTLSQLASARLLGFGIMVGSLQPELTFCLAQVEQFAETLRNTFDLVSELLVRASLLCGVVFMIIGLMKFKAHKDMPAQIPLSTPIVLMAVGSALLFLPTFSELAGSALFGSMAKSGFSSSGKLNF
jgi:hypothetical protein